MAKRIERRTSKKKVATYFSAAPKAEEGETIVAEAPVVGEGEQKTDPKHAADAKALEVQAEKDRVAAQAVKDQEVKDKAAADAKALEVQAEKDRVAAQAVKDQEVKDKAAADAKALEVQAEKDRVAAQAVKDQEVKDKAAADAKALEVQAEKDRVIRDAQAALVATEMIIQLNPKPTGSKSPISLQIHDDVITALDQFVHTFKYAGRPDLSMTKVVEEALIEFLNGQRVQPLPEELQRKSFIISYDEDCKNHVVKDKAKRSKIVFIGDEEACKTFAADNFN